MKPLKHIDSLLDRIESTAITLILSMMILLSFSQVIMRNLFNEGLLWADIFLRQLVLWVGFLGASLAAREGRHISIDVLPNLLPGNWKNTIRIVVQLTAGVISALLAWAAWKFVAFEMEAESVLFLDLPVWMFQTILPYSFCVISARCLCASLNSLLSPDESASK